jgi:hypothetical protein
VRAVGYAALTGAMGFLLWCWPAGSTVMPASLAGPRVTAAGWATLVLARRAAAARPLRQRHRATTALTRCPASATRRRAAVPGLSEPCSYELQ